MPVDDSAEILQELCSLVHDELKVLSYKWVARHYSISANAAKRVLFQLAEQQRDKVRTVYLVSGWTKQEPPSHVHRLVEADQLQVCRESLKEVTGMHVYSVAPNQATNPDSLWQVTYQQSQQLLKEIMSGQPSASAEAFRRNSCSAVHFTAPAPQQQKQQRPPMAAAPSTPVTKTAGPAQCAVQPPQLEPKAETSVTDAAGGGTAVPQAAAVVAPASSPQIAAGTFPADASGPSPPKAPGGKVAGKGAVPAPPKPNTLANMWNKASGKPKAASAVSAPTAVTEAVPARESSGGAEDEDEEDLTVHVAAASSRGRKRRGAQIEDSEDEGSKELAPEAVGPAAPAAVEGSAGQQQPKAQEQERGQKGGNARGGGKAPKVEASKVAGAKRAKTTVAAAAAPAAAALLPAAEVVESGDNDADMDEAVVGALETAAAAVQPQPLPGPTRPAGGGGGDARGRKVTRTYINDQGEEVTEEVWDGGPAPLQPQQYPQQQPAGPTAAALAKGASGGTAAAAKLAAKMPAAAAKTAKGKASAAGQKSMTAFFSKK